MINLKAQRDADASNHRREAEKNAAAAMVTDDEEGSLEQFVRNVLLPRHLKEMADLTERLHRAMEAAKQEARAKVAYYQSSILNHLHNLVLKFCSRLLRCLVRDFCFSICFYYP